MRDLVLTTALLATLAVILALPGCSSQPNGTVTNIVQDVTAACTDYEDAKPAGAVVDLLVPAAAAVVASLEAYGDSICSAPVPQTDAGTAAWIGQITGQILAVSNPPAAKAS